MFEQKLRLSEQSKQRALCTFSSLLPPDLAALLRSAVLFTEALFFARVALSRSAFHGFSIGFKAVQTPFVVEARGRLGAEVVPFLKQHAPPEPLRSAVLARATGEISIITQRGLAALLLAAELRPAAM